MKKSVIVPLLWLFLAASAFQGYGAGSAADTEAQKLIDKAGYYFGLLEDYPRALKFLAQALEKTGNPRIKAEALLKTAYVYSLIGRQPGNWRHYIEKALALDPGLEPDPVYYNRRFMEVFSLVKKKPGLEEKITLTKTGKIIHAQPAKRKKFFMKIGLALLLPADSNYRDVYGGLKFFPRVKAGYYVLGKTIYPWISYGSMPASGTIPGEGIEAKSKQRFFSFGAGLRVPLSASWDSRFEIGVMRARVREETLGLQYSGSIQGFDAGFGLLLHLNKRFFIDIFAGYFYASETAYQEEFKTGGFNTGIGLGIKI